jgi:hypothetical protein
MGEEMNSRNRAKGSGERRWGRREADKRGGESFPYL